MAKFYIDVPYFKRCCFCIPLRYGLLAWGCLNLYIMSIAVQVDFDSFTTSPVPWLYIVMILSNVLLIAAAIMKNQKLYQTYYIYAIIELVLILLMFVFIQICSIMGWSLHIVNNSSATVDIALLLSFFIHGYITLMVRSALIKLREAAAYQVTDNTVEIQPQSQSPVEKSVDV